MAGLGRKTWSAGEVATAANIQGYLQDQTVMKFANTTAAGSALGTAVSEGMTAYLSDTDEQVMYNGTSWFKQNGTTNAIINGAFDINQRSFTSASSPVATYGFDRWVNVGIGTGGSATFSAQTFTPGTAPMAGYEGANFLRIVTTGQTGADIETDIQQKIEDVRSFAGQTVTISFFAKAASGTPAIALAASQAFGTGGSPATLVNVGKTTISTSWARYSLTYAVPSITGKTIGAGSSLQFLFYVSAGSAANSWTGSLGIQSNTFDIWGVQLEAGSVATPFKRNAPSIQAELAACQRYFYDPLFNTSAANRAICNANAYSSTAAFGLLNFPTSMRVAPSINSTASSFALGYSGSATLTSMTIEVSQPDSILLLLQVASGLTTNASYHLYRPGTTATLQFSAEL